MLTFEKEIDFGNPIKIWEGLFFFIIQKKPSRRLFSNEKQRKTASKSNEIGYLHEQNGIFINKKNIYAEDDRCHRINWGVGSIHIR